MNIENKLEELRKKYKECEDPVIREVIKRQAKALKLSQIDKNEAGSSQSSLV